MTSSDIVAKIRAEKNFNIDTLILEASNVEISNNIGLIIPVGTTDERGTTSRKGTIRYNSTDTAFEGYDGTSWGTLGGVKDVSQTTLIRAETSPNANNKQLDFITDDTQRMQIDANGDLKFGDISNNTSPDIKFFIDYDSGDVSAQNILPKTDKTYSLGDSNNKWKQLHLDSSGINIANIASITKDVNNSIVLNNTSGNFKITVDSIFKSNLTICGELIVDNDVSLNSNVDISNHLNVDGDVSLNANVDINNHLNVDGDVSLNSNVDICGNLNFSGTINGNINANIIANNSVSNTEFQYLNGLTSDIQTQLNDISAAIPTANTQLENSANYITFGKVTGANVDPFGWVTGSRTEGTYDLQNMPYNNEYGTKRNLILINQGWRYWTIYASVDNPSDNRLKHNEIHITNGLDIIRQLKPQKYQKTLEMKEADYNGDVSGYWHWESGFIAQEILEIDDLKYIVKGGDYIDSSGNLVPAIYHLEGYKDIFVYNVQATKELDIIVQRQQTEITELKSEITQLKNENTLLKNALNTLLTEAGKPTI
jgi:cytoskeletal protein CcmA (bactofilin family)